MMVCTQSMASQSVCRPLIVMNCDSDESIERPSPCVQAITFAFADCPLCKVPIEHPSLPALLEPIRSLQVPPGFGRIVVSEREAPSMLVNLV